MNNGYRHHISDKRTRKQIYKPSNWCVVVVFFLSFGIKLCIVFGVPFFLSCYFLYCCFFVLFCCFVHLSVQYILSGWHDEFDIYHRIFDLVSKAELSNTLVRTLSRSRVVHCIVYCSVSFRIRSNVCFGVCIQNRNVKLKK